jgi:hypothetical protein
MTSYKKISFAFALAMLFQLTNCAENNEFIPSRLGILKEKYEYSVDEKPMQTNKPDRDLIVISDTIQKHATDTGFTRTKVTTKIKDGLLITTTKKWVTKHWSYATFWNTLIAFVALVSISKKTIDYMHPNYYKLKYSSDQNNSNADEKSKLLSDYTSKLSPNQVFALNAIDNSPWIPLLLSIGIHLSKEKLNKEIVEKETTEFEEELEALQEKN